MSFLSYPIVEVTPQIRTAVEAIVAMYQQHPTGGAMHVATDDWNIDDESVAWCGQSSMDGLERACFEALRALNEDERATALQIFRLYDDDDLSRSVPRAHVTAEHLAAGRQMIAWTPTRNHVFSVDRAAVPGCSCGRRWPEVDGEDGLACWDMHVDTYDRPCGPSREPLSRFEELHNKVLAVEGKPPAKW